MDKGHVYASGCVERLTYTKPEFWRFGFSQAVIIFKTSVLNALGLLSGH